jgi:putative zinc finger/helix-turn-helix YgiT family protein
MNLGYCCMVCGSSRLSEASFAERVKMGRAVVAVEGLKRLECDACGESFVPEEWADENLMRTRAALDSTQASVSRGMLKSFRQTWGLSQREASLLFAAGGSAFAKWESGQSQLSGPAALLVQCANKFPRVAVYLSRLAKVDLKAKRRPPFAEEVAAAFLHEAAEYDCRFSVFGDLVEEHANVVLAYAGPGVERTKPKSHLLRHSSSTASTEWARAA